MPQTSKSTPIVITTPTGQSAGWQKWWMIFVIPIVLLLIVFIGFQIIRSRAYIEVSVQSSLNSEITYRFVDQANQKATEVKQTSKHLKQRLSRSKYEVTVTQANTSFFEIAEAKGTPAKVRAVPQTQKGRRFIGNQPRSCMNLLGDLLLTYTCKGILDNLQTHLPATVDTPTHTEQVSPGDEDVIEGFVQTKSGQGLLFVNKAVDSDEAFGGKHYSPHVVFVPQKTANQAGIDIGNGTALTSLDKNKTYTFTPYQDGFLAYDQEFKQAFYYNSVGAKPNAITLPRPADRTNLRPYALSIRDGLDVVAFSKSDNSMGAKATSSMIVQNGKQHRQYDFEQVYQTVQVCGQDKLCLLDKDKKTFDVYDVSSKDQKLLFSVDSVRDFATLSDDTVALVRGRDVLSLNTTTRTGYTQYGFGDYNYCGMQQVVGTYLLCVNSKQGSRAVLYIDQQQISDEIDKKVSELSGLSDVKAISIYGSFISISPDAGDLEYIDSIGGFYYNPDTIEQANKAINAELNSLNIDRSKYTITNTLESAE